MNPTKLYIIGNGFDIWHTIPSKYADFKAYLREANVQLFRTVERFLPDETSWGGLETALKEFDVNYLVEDLSHFMASVHTDGWRDFSQHTFQQEVGRVVRGLSYKLHVCFCDWIRSLTIPSPQTAPKKLVGIDTDAAFLTFNYTSTLRDVYNVPDTNVLHIHGKSELPDSEVILGHAWRSISKQPQFKRSDTKQLNFSTYQANEIMDAYFSKTFKSSERLISDNSHFFNQLGGIEVVEVIGHSLSDVDIAYLNTLLSIPSISHAHWTATCTEASKLNLTYQRLLDLGVHPKRASAVVLRSN